MRNLLLVILMLSWGICEAAESMNQASMEAIVKSKATESKGENGVVEFAFNGVTMYLISDTTHDRMRIVAPVVEYAKLTKAQIDSVMESNYHRALDARYAVSDGVLFSVYIHPLAELTEKQIRSAVEQVSVLALTFGTEYSSGQLNFGGQ
jgi:hypothetical protein